ncbi:MAG: hypothetical protein PGN37_00660 [Mycobacterium kyogaense]|uniref:hypothetical protein n=1 Tax=Mycobacterium kyogaense TaxID=2212479 RepID=UPI002FF72CDD
MSGKEEAATAVTRALRAGLVAAGLVSVAYGAWLLVDLNTTALIRIAVWIAVGVVIHDFVFAPVTAALGYTGRRWLGRRWWPAVAVAATCSVTLVLLAVPVFDTPGAKPDNSTVLDRDYPLGLSLSLAVVWACVPVYVAVSAMVRRRRHVVSQ